MTSPAEQVNVRCPKCEHDFEFLYRASMNREHFLDLSDDEFERYAQSFRIVKCPSCMHRFQVGGQLVVDGGRWDYQ